MVNNYIDIQSPGYEGFLLIYRIFHGCISEKNNTANSLAISFPDYCFEANRKKGNCTLGKRLRIFGKIPSLLRFLNNPYIVSLSKAGVVTITDPLKIPEKTYPVCFVRDRRLDRYFRDWRDSDRTMLSEFKFPFITLDSSRSNNKFTLRIRQDFVEEYSTGEYSSYGLSKDGSTVPWWNEHTVEGVS
ncbi:MAG: hypothetical protein ACI86H_001269 [bacterium]|jgi:hypothetical protein